MNENKPEVSRTEGWDQDKGEYFERITCPACGYCVTVYEHGDIVVERERDPMCPCCADEVRGAPVTPDDYGSSWKDNDNYQEGNGCILMFIGLLVLPIIIALFMVNVLGMFH